MSVNILVVDDSSVVRKMIVKMLHLAELPIAEVYEAGNGLEGLSILNEYWVDVVFADINMPIMNGEEMIERIRQNPLWADLPLVVVSTEGSETRVNHLRAMKARFIHKPFAPETVRSVVTEMLGLCHEQPAT